MNLESDYLGLRLKNPMVASASPLMEKIDNIRALEDSGAGAVVLHSLFEEQVKHEDDELDHFMLSTADNSAEAASYFPAFKAANLVPTPISSTFVRQRRP